MTSNNPIGQATNQPAAPVQPSINPNFQSQFQSSPLVGASQIPEFVDATNGSIAQKRAATIAAFNLGAVPAAPAWAATTAYLQYQPVTTSNGQILVCETAGTSGATAPVYTPSNYNGRPLTDGSVVWSGTVIDNAPSDLPLDQVPTVTLYASAAAAGLTETIICTGTGNTILNAAMSVFCGLAAPGAGYQSSLSAFGFASALAAGGGNATGPATSQGYSALYGYQLVNWDVEWHVTDSVVAVTVPGASGYPICLEVDGVTISPLLSGATAGQCFVCDYGGLVKRRKVRFNGQAPGALTMRGIALSTSGYIEATDSNPNDQMLFIGDSIGGSLGSGQAASNGAVCLGSCLKRYLGITGLLTATISGSGYYNASTSNIFNILQVMQNPANQLIFPQYNPSHILHTSGFNDSTFPWALVGPNALATWQITRQLFPNAKISITDGWSQATGPNPAIIAQAANLLALFNSWGDKNSRFIQSVGNGTTQPWTRGVGNSTIAQVAGNASWVVGAGGTHCTGVGAAYQAKRLAAAIKLAWNGDY